MGLTREQAAHMLAHGWRRDTIKTIHLSLRDIDANVADFVSYWGLKLDNGLLLYRSYTPDDVERAIQPPVDQRKDVVIFTDGSGTKEDKPAGIGVVVYRPWGQPEYIAQNIGLGTNNRAELAAIWRGLQAVPDTCQKILIRSDSEYAMGMVETNRNRANVNIPLIEAIRLDLAQRRDACDESLVTFQHVNGHAGVLGNEIADRLAGIGRKLITDVTKFEE
jgi:ribonuclease HI